MNDDNENNCPPPPKRCPRKSFCDKSINKCVPKNVSKSDIKEKNPVGRPKKVMVQLTSQLKKTLKNARERKTRNDKGKTRKKNTIATSLSRTDIKEKNPVGRPKKVMVQLTSQLKKTLKNARERKTRNDKGKTRKKNTIATSLSRTEIKEKKTVGRPKKKINEEQLQDIRQINEDDVITEDNEEVEDADIMFEDNQENADAITQDNGENADAITQDNGENSDVITQDNGENSDVITEDNEEVEDADIMFEYNQENADVTSDDDEDVITQDNEENSDVITQDNEEVEDEDAGADSNSDNDVKIKNIKLNKREIDEQNELKLNKKYDFLYPTLNDPKFNEKITQRKEFNDNKYIGDIFTDIEEHSNLLCSSDFELAPHQMFVRNFLSFNTPYNSLLLYHGLGSGKTCSAISVAEEMRDYIINIGISSQIIIVASPNVQTNFRFQLFDKNKLKLVDGLWNIRSCSGNRFLKEINPMNMKGLTKDNVIKQINKLIDTYYSFYGYVEFANEITRVSKIDDSTITNEKTIQNIIRNKLRKVYKNSLIIIDEVHNIRISDDNKDKRVAEELYKLVKNVSNLRLLLLSGTPMFNTYKEIIWLINLMNMNDNRSTIDSRDVFDKNGEFKKDGKELLERKSTGYISFVRGENPYTFPYRVWPSTFASDFTFDNIGGNIPYPQLQINGTSQLSEDKRIKYIPLYIVNTGEYQQKGYSYIIEKIANIENIETFGYTTLQQPLEGLNIIYPHEGLDNGDKTLSVNEIIGGQGLKRIMNWNEDTSIHTRSNFNYNSDILKKYGRIFSSDNIGKYSNKIKTICDNILKSTGIVLVYSQYIDAGLVPLALALEEIGFSRAGNQNSLFADKVTKKTKGLHYVMITGDKGLSANPLNDIKMAINDDNINGNKVKVILISQTGTEGLDLKFIRQVHILEPWYNMNRMEQIFGRAIRTCSHKLLPLKKRNVELYLYASLQLDEYKSNETVDLYIYRFAELKSIQIGKISRLLKENSVDCMLNKGQTSFTEENMEDNGVKPITLELSSGINIENYKVGDKPYSSMCDYMEQCDYKCKSNNDTDADNDTDNNIVSMDSYNEDYIMVNTDKIIFKIKQLMKERFFYNKEDIIGLLNTKNIYKTEQINTALHQLIEDENEHITDKYGRIGHLININDLYLFQPIEINDKKISIFDRSVPLDVKHKKIIVKMNINKPKDSILVNDQEKDNIIDLISKLQKNYKNAINPPDPIIVNTKTLKKSDEQNWYKLCNKQKDKLITNGINEETIHYLITQHIIDELNATDMILLLNNIYENKEYDSDEEKIYKYINKYIKKQLITGKNNITGLIWKDKLEQVVIVKQHNDNIWYIAEAEDLKDLKESINMKRDTIINSLNNIIGFMINFKNDDYIVFKTKDRNKILDLGSRCDQKSKTKGIEMLTEIIGENIYSTKGIIQSDICIIQELYLRIYDNELKDKKRWILNPSETILTNIDKKPKK